MVSMYHYEPKTSSMTLFEPLKWILWNGWYGYLGDKLAKKKSPPEINQGGKTFYGFKLLLLSNLLTQI